MHLTPGQRDLALTVVRAHAAETNLHLRLARSQLGSGHRQVGQLTEAARLANETVAALQSHGLDTEAA